jgi:dipeptidyl aminopeptidase/acylaminoacyl peptidase
MQTYKRFIGFQQPCAWISLVLAAGISAATGAPPPVAEPTWEKLTNGVLGQPAEFEGAGGVKIAGYVRKPAGAGPFPLVILLHGAGPKAKNVSAELMPQEIARASEALGRASAPTIQDFLAQGWAVYYIDYRPNPRYKIDPLEFEDTFIAYKKARAFPFVDSKRIAIIGGSHGGHVTGRMTSRADLCCAVLCAPAGLDLIELSHLFEKQVKIGANQGLIREMEQRSNAKMAEIEKNPETYHYSSLLTEIPQVKCPIFLISGKNDPNAPLPLMDAYLDKLRAAGKEVEPPYHPDNGPHGFYVGLPRHIPETDEATRLEVAFIKKHFEQVARGAEKKPQTAPAQH